MRSYLITIGSISYITLSTSSCQAAVNAIQLHPEARGISVRAMRTRSAA